MDKAVVAVKEGFDVSADCDRTWAVLDDIALIAQCIPNAKLKPSNQEGTYAGSISVKLGPVGVDFQGEATIDRWPDERRGLITARGQDRFGSRVHAAIDFAVGAGGPAQTRVGIEGAIEVSGRLAGFARTGGQALARNLVGDFAKNLEWHMKNVEPREA
ncbi:MAG: hypothetical protein KGJ86_06980 [Chloroflexota bacterium]|nr:hypothetical protein [Chloroflexota bacterium]